MGSFEVHPEILGQNVVLGDLPLSRVILMNDARYPWLMLLPRTEAYEIVDLTGDQQVTLIREIAAASAAVRGLFNPDKLNVAALGNMVRQMHVHVLGRWKTDPAWPGPVWGHSPAVRYGAAELQATAGRFSGALAAAGLKTVAA